MSRLPFWSDDFDMDLIKVLPKTEEILGDTADLKLYTYGATTFGRLNHPSVWNGDGGMLAFFGTENYGFKPDCFYSGEDVVPCTFLEAVRDAWPHSYILHVDFVEIWNTWKLRALFDALMWHRRGWRALPDGRAEELIESLSRSLRAASERLRKVAA